jgi:[acyl-carrier-protein] S-malonyltransferase
MFDLPRTDPHADASLNDSLSGARLGMPLQPILADNGALFSNRMAQPLIVAATMATGKPFGRTFPRPLWWPGTALAKWPLMASQAPLIPLTQLHWRHCARD